VGVYGAARMAVGRVIEADIVNTAYVTSTYLPSPKASTVQVMMMCQAMARLGHAVTLILPKGHNDPPPAETCAYYGVEPTFDIVRLARGNWRGGAALYQVRGVLRARLGRDGVCYARGRDYVAPALALALGAQAVFEVHGLPASPREAAVLRWLARSPRARLVAISNALCERYGELRVASCGVSPDGVDLRRFTPPLDRVQARRACRLPGAIVPLDRPLVMYAGGLYKGRGLEELIAAMVSLSAGLVIVGGRDEAEIARFRALAFELGVEATFTGHRPPAQIPCYLFAADVLAMPYSSSVETASGEDTASWMSPLKMFEYLAAGRPIVASDLPALREVLRHESNALLAKPGSAASLREQIERLLADESLARRLGQQARLDAEAYSWERRAERILGQLT